MSKLRRSCTKVPPRISGVGEVGGDLVLAAGIVDPLGEVVDQVTGVGVVVVDPLNDLLEYELRIRGGLPLHEVENPAPRRCVSVLADVQGQGAGLDHQRLLRWNGVRGFGALGVGFLNPRPVRDQAVQTGALAAL